MESLDRLRPAGERRKIDSRTAQRSGFKENPDSKLDGQCRPLSVVALRLQPDALVQTTLLAERGFKKNGGHTSARTDRSSRQTELSKRKKRSAPSQKLPPPKSIPRRFGQGRKLKTTRSEDLIFLRFCQKRVAQICRFVGVFANSMRSPRIFQVERRTIKEGRNWVLSPALRD